MVGPGADQSFDQSVEDPDRIYMENSDWTRSADERIADEIPSRWGR